MDIKELIELTGRSEKTIRTNYPKFVLSMAKKGIFIKREGKNFDTADFTVTYGQPEKINYQDVSSRKFETNLIEGQVWIKSYLGDDLEISNFGRYRWTKEKTHFYRGGKTSKQGYLSLTYKNKPYRVHRVVLQSFSPIPLDQLNSFTVDHINGIRTDNSLNNLRWVPLEQNVTLMMKNRSDLNKELTRIIQKIGYEETLKLLQTL